MRQVRVADGRQARAARAVLGLQRLSQMSKHQTRARRNEGKAEIAATASAQESSSGGRDYRDLPGVRRAHETAARPPRLLPRLLQISQVQGNPRSIA